MTAGLTPEAVGFDAEERAARGDWLGAVATYRAGIARFPDSLPLAINFARLLRARPEGAADAVAILRSVVALAPGFAPARMSLIETLRTATAQLDEAEAVARGYLQRFPDDPDGCLALALVLFDGGRLVDAAAAADCCLGLRPGTERAWELKATIAVALGDASRAMACYRAMILDAPDAANHSRLLMAMQYCDEIDEALLLAETRNWVRLHAQGILPRRSWPGLGFDPERRLNVGVLSRDFRQCSLPHLSLPLFQRWPSDWTLTLYANVELTDHWTERFRAMAGRWVDIVALDDDQVAERIRGDRIDVLFDINGHTLGGRPGVFARKPAPIQLAWLDYVGTTGLAAMDGIIGDPGHLPLTDQRWYVEPIRHVAANLYRYAPPDAAPAVAPLPALASGAVTFGCFSSAYKLSATTLGLWARVLRKVPASRLLLNSHEYGNPDTRRRFQALFAERGIDPSRVELRPGAPHPLGMQAGYRDVDIALDTSPYSGGLTTLEALYMGVPVITAPGHRFGSRHSAVHLRTIGLDDWVAADGDGYVALAVGRAGDLDGLARLRAGLRSRLERSPVMDGAALAADFSKLVREMWWEVCCRQTQKDIA